MFRTNRTLLRTIERQQAAHDQQIQTLIETVCVLAGRQLAPTEADLWEQHRADERSLREDFEERYERDLVDADQLP